MGYGWRVAVGLIALVLYMLFVLWSATNYISMANKQWLYAHEKAFLARVHAEDSALANPGVPPDQVVEAALKQLVPTDLEPPRAASWWQVWKWVDQPDWIGAGSIGSWVRLHEAQRLEVWRLPMAAVEARFGRAMGQVDELPATRQAAWQGRWLELQSMSRASGRERTDAWRAELSQLLAELFNARDATYNQLVSLFGKAGWAFLVASLSIAALIVGDYGFVLLAGFVGGLISRMQRLVYAQGRPTAYGTSWVPMFLAPLLGGLAAWGGLHLLALLQELSIVNMAGVLRPEAFKGPAEGATLGLSLILGFSERFFNQVGNQAEKVIGTTDEGTAATSGSPGRPSPRGEEGK
jgi:hypothetical protein